MIIKPRFRELPEKFSRILVVDDDKGVNSLLSEYFEMLDFQVDSAETGEQALEFFKPNKYAIAILDLKLPGMSGVELLKHIRKEDKQIQVIMLTAFQTTSSAIQALREGAYDYLSKPFDLEEVKYIIQNAVAQARLKYENQILLKELQVANDKLTKKVEAADRELAKRHEELKKNAFEVLKSFAMALETKDPYTAGHSERVDEYSVRLAKKLKLSSPEIEIIHTGAILHDIGKLFISSQILTKPSRLTDDEYQIVKEHPTLGSKFLEPITFLKDSIPLIRNHHERIDGKGYPDGKDVSNLTVKERIIIIADAYDAMASSRPYRKNMPKETIVSELEKCAGTQFDPDMIKVFIEMLYEDGEISESLFRKYYAFR